MLSKVLLLGGRQNPNLGVKRSSLLVQKNTDFKVQSSSFAVSFIDEPYSLVGSKTVVEQEVAGSIPGSAYNLSEDWL